MPLIRALHLLPALLPLAAALSMACDDKPVPPSYSGLPDTADVPSRSDLESLSVDELIGWWRFVLGEGTSPELEKTGITRRRHVYASLRLSAYDGDKGAAERAIVEALRARDRSFKKVSADTIRGRDIRTGMSQAQVKAILGLPDFIHKSDGPDGARESWSYHDGISEKVSIEWKNGAVSSWKSFR